MINTKTTFPFFLHCLFMVAGLLLFIPAKSQVSGCTDPLANNYNPAATVNNGTCTYNVINYTPPVKVDPLSNMLVETSGLQMAGNFLWTFNDGGGEAAIYKIDTISSNVLQKVVLAGALNIDWEDIAYDGIYLYIGDIGNNANGARRNLKIYRFPFSAIADHTNYPVDTIPSGIIEQILFSYSDQPQPTVSVAANSTKYDCEAMIVDSGQIHLFTKDWTGNNTTHYVINGTTAGTYTATPLETLQTDYLVTAADMASDKTICLLGYQNSGTAKHYMHLLSGYKNGQYFNGNKRKINLPDVFYMGQAEGLTFTNGLYGYISNEQFIRYISSNPVLTITPKLHSFDVSSFVTKVGLNYYFIGNGNWNMPSNWKNNEVPPSSLVPGSTIYIDPLPEGACILNINYTLSAGCNITVNAAKSFIIEGALDIKK